MSDDFPKFLDELRARISLVDLVSEKVKITKRGREYLGLCPFHQEKTPSFTVNESRGFYHCFGCGAHGDIIGFLMQAEGLSFMEAVQKLAQRVNLPIPNLSPESRAAAAKRKSSYEIMEMAAAFFEKNLWLPVGNEGLKYLKYERHFSDETIKKFRLGYAPTNNALKSFLSSKGVSEREMVDLGLIAYSENKQSPAHDFFRNRVIIPITDKNKNMIAFGGRILSKSQPKYLNSPETQIFNKRKILYNLNFAREASYHQKRLIICEGYMDVIALDSFGFEYAVAPLGTALTEEQILEAWKICPVPTLCFDGDKAGINAAIRSIDRVLPLLRAGCSVNYIFLKEKKDPDELLHTLGPDVFERYLSRAKPLVDILWHKCKMNKGIDTPEQKALIESEIYTEINKIKDEKIRSYYIQEMRSRIYNTFGKGSVYRNNVSNKKSQPSKHGYNLVKKPPLSDYILRNIVASMLLYPELIRYYADKLNAFELDQSEMSKILIDIIEIFQNEQNIDKDILIEKISLNHANEIKNLWELSMFQQQKTPILELKQLIDTGLNEIQLKQLNAEIKECMQLMQKNPEDSEKLNKRYQYLLQERLSLLS